MNYWQRLKTLKCTHKKDEWRFTEPSMCGLEVINSDRRGREVRIPPNKGSGKTQSLREASFQVHGPRLFNSLPKSIRSLKNISVDEFKLKLDQFLVSIPDEPKVSDYIPSACNQITGKPSNSIIDYCKSETMAWLVPIMLGGGPFPPFCNEINILISQLLEL